MATPDGVAIFVLTAERLKALHTLAQSNAPG